MNTEIQKKPLYIYLGFAFGIAWLTALILFFNGGIANSPEIIPGTKITLALVLMAIVYMWAPALAHIFTRLVTHMGWQDLYLRPNFKKNWKFWAAAWITPALATILGGVLYFLLFPAQYDANLTTLSKALAENPASANVNPWIVVIGQLVSAILVSPVINGFFTFGEEFGWRGFMFPRMLPMGEKKAYLVSGVIWGLWHAPVIAMGHNYGLEYPGFPWLGILAMVWFCILAGTFLAWASTQAGSVWPAVIGHAAVNGIAGVALLFLLGTPFTLLGPTPVGIVGSVGYLIVFCLIFFRKQTA